MTRMDEFTARSRGPLRAMRRSLAVLLLWSGLAAAQGEPEAPEPTNAATVFDERVPFQRWPRLGPKAVGLLMVRGSPWGYAGALAPSGPRSYGDERFQLYVEGRSAGSFMLPARGTGPNISERPKPVELPDGGMVRAVMWLAQGTVPELKAAGYLVRVTVNGGKGFYGDGALYSDLEVLDGTAQYPIVIARAMDEAKARWDRYRASQKGRLDQMLDLGRRKVEWEISIEEERKHRPGAAPPPYDPEAGALPPGVAPSRAQAKWGPDQETVYAGFFPSWRDDPGELSLLFSQRLVRERRRSYRHMQVHHCPPGAPCLPPRMETMTEQKTHGAAIAFAITFDRSGKVIREEPFPPVQAGPPVGRQPGDRPWQLPPTVQPRGTRR